MKKSLLPFYAIASLFISACSCNKTEISLTEFEEVTAEAFGTVQTKTHLDANAFNLDRVTLVWDQGDRLGAFGEVTTNSIFEASSVNSSTATFKGIQNKGDRITCAYYPYVAGAEDKTAIPVNIYDSQTLSSVARSDIRATNSVSLENDLYGFAFKFVTSFVKLNVDLSGFSAITDNEAILGIKVTSEASSKIAGSYTLNLTNLKLTPVAASSTVTVPLDGRMKAVDGAVTSLISVAPTLRKGEQIGVEVETSSHKVYAHFTCQQDFVPGYAYIFDLRFRDASASNGLKVTSKEASYSVPDISELTREQKVGQLFFVRPEDLNNNSTVTSFTSQISTKFNTYPVGGVCLFAQNIQNPAQIIQLNKQLHSLPGYPIITVDEEGGRVARIGKNSNFDVPTYSSMLAVGNTGDPAVAYEAGKSIGAYLRQYGFDLDFAPVADVFTNPSNTVIGDRAFSSDPQVAAAMMTSFLYGLKANAVEGCLKHFPGHGDTSTDSHYGYAEAPKTWAQMLTCEMLPFQAGIANGAKMIMSAHVTCPNVTTDGRPSSLSYQMITGKLRGELGYEGLVITDGMGMAAVTKQFPNAGDAALAALNAGADIILLPASLSTAYTAVLNAVKNGTLSEARLNQSVEKILQLKRDILAGRGELE